VSVILETNRLAVSAFVAVFLLSSTADAQIPEIATVHDLRLGFPAVASGADI
jgi:hypothetical protein